MRSAHSDAAGFALAGFVTIGCYVAVVGPLAIRATHSLYVSPAGAGATGAAAEAPKASPKPSAHPGGAIHVNRAYAGFDTARRRIAALSVTNGSRASASVADAALRVIERNDEGREIYRKTFEAAELRDLRGTASLAPGETEWIALPAKLPTQLGHIEARLRQPGLPPAISRSAPAR